METDPMVSIFDNTFDSLNTSCGKVNDEISFYKSSDFWDKPVSSVFIKRKICFSDPFFVMKSNLCEIS
jgi:hypothetical protein